VLEKDTKNTVRLTGRVHTPPQKHFYMETQTCVAEPVPNEHGHGDGVVLTHSTQGPSIVQRSVAVVLGVKQHMVTVKQQHAGGAFGAKMYRNVHVACAASVAAIRLRRPVRLTLDLQTDMQTTGGRPPGEPLD
jgi:xanthine dehydrogenase molybdopterin-binding subunit B